MTSSVSNVLYSKFARFFHSANFRDFQAYCAQGALLARSELMQSPGSFTPFYSDQSDEDRGVLGRVFGNLQDFNSLFWAADGCVPNAYGPITLVFSREIWNVTSDVAVTRENAASKGYELDRCRMDEETVDSCFKLFDGRWWRLTCDGLEVSLGISAAPLTHVQQIVVDPIYPEFESRVRDFYASNGGDSNKVIGRTIGSRELPDERIQVLHDLVDWSRGLNGKVPSTDDLRAAIPDSLKDWASGLREPLWGPLKQWLEYTYVGSLSIEDWGSPK